MAKGQMPAALKAYWDKKRRGKVGKFTGRPQFTKTPRKKARTGASPTAAATRAHDLAVRLADVVTAINRCPHAGKVRLVSGSPAWWCMHCGAVHNGKALERPVLHDQLRHSFK